MINLSDNFNTGYISGNVFSECDFKPQNINVEYEQSLFKKFQYKFFD